MEGPSIYLAVEQHSPFINKKILSVPGNTKTEKDRLIAKKVISIFAVGKQLFFQFEKFALRVHFLLYGTFQATLKGKKITGDYEKKTSPRLTLNFKLGDVAMYSCSVKFIEDADAKKLYDLSTEIMADEWNKEITLKKIRAQPYAQIGDILLDQEIFAGVGNIIKNEVLLLSKTVPTANVFDLSLIKLKEIINKTRKYVFQFYEWRKKFELKTHYLVYRQSICNQCENKIKMTHTGQRKRISFICFICQK